MGKTFHSSYSRRAALVGASCLIVGCATANDTSARPKRVLFVCQFGTVKSPIARELFRREAESRGALVRAESRGVSPEDHVSHTLQEALNADGLEIRRDPVRALDRSDLAEADIIVLFDALPAMFGIWAHRNWSDLPSMNADYVAARDILVGRITALLDELEIGASAAPT